MEWSPILATVDPYVIWLYRLTGIALLDFLIGTFVLAWIALVVGEFTISLVFLALRKRIDQNNSEVTRYSNLANDALRAGDKTAYTAANKMANDAFGKSFFLQIGMSGAFLWPIFFILAWMNYRFAGVDFNLLWTDFSVGYPCLFIALYAGAYIMFKRLKRKLPYFKRICAILDAYGESAKDLSVPGDPPGIRRATAE